MDRKRESQPAKIFARTAFREETPPLSKIRVPSTVVLHRARSSEAAFFSRGPADLLSRRLEVGFAMSIRLDFLIARTSRRTSTSFRRRRCLVWTTKHAGSDVGYRF